MVEPFRRLFPPKAAVGPIICLSLSPFGGHLAAGNDAGEIVIWKVSTFEEVHRFVANKHDTEKAVETIKWHPRHRSLFFYGCRDGSVLTYDFEVGLSLNSASAWLSSRFYVGEGGPNSGATWNSGHCSCPRFLPEN